MNKISVLDDLCIDLHNEMGCCDDCPAFQEYGSYGCVDCATQANIEHIKGKISSLIRGTENEQV